MDCILPCAFIKRIRSNAAFCTHNPFNPYPLSPYYLTRWYASILEPKVIFAIIVLASISFLAFKVRKDKIMLFLLAFPFIMLAPVIWQANIIMGNVYIAERFLYVPAMMSSIFVSACSAKIFRDNTRYLAACWIFIIAAFTLLTISTNKIWRDDIIHFERVANAAPDNPVVHSSLADAYSKQGQFDKAVKEYLLALKLTHAVFQGRDSQIYNHYILLANVKEIYRGLGDAYYNQGQLDEAITIYKTALRSDPDNANIHNNLGITYYDKGKMDEAVKEYKAVLKLIPDDANAHNNLGNVYYKQNQIDDAINEYLTASNLSPNNAQIYYNLGISYRKKGLKDEARKAFETTLKLNHDFSEARKALEQNTRRDPRSLDGGQGELYK